MVWTSTEGILQLRRHIAVLEIHDRWLQGSGGSALKDLEDDVVSAIGGPAADEILTRFAQRRKKLADLQSPEAVRRFMSKPVSDLLAASDIKLKDRGTVRNFEQFRDWMKDDSQTFRERDFTRGTPTAGGSNVGSATVHEILVDQDGYPLDGGWAEDVRLKCVGDKLTGNQFKTLWQYEGETKSKDWAEVAGSGLLVPFGALDSQATLQFAQNPSFDIYAGTAPTAGGSVTPASNTAITGWTLDDKTKFRLQLDRVFRGAAGGQTPLGLEFIGDGSVSQVVTGRTAAIRTALEAGKPVIVAPALYRGSSGDGTLTMSYLGQTKAVDIAADLTNSAWERVPIALDATAFPEDASNSEESLSFVLSGWSTGYVGIDDIIIGVPSPIDGRWLALIGGETDSRRDDVFSFTNSEGTRAVNIYWMLYRSGISRALGRPLAFPTAAGGYETIAEAA